MFKPIFFSILTLCVVGHSGMLSFYQNKIITTGEGGAICTDDEDIYKKLLLIRSHGRVEQKGTDYFSNIHEMDYIEVGYNYRLPTICAALGISQLEKIEKILELRREKGQYYDENLKNISGIKIIPELDGHRVVYQLYSIMLEDPNKKAELQDFLLERGIFTKIYFYPIHLKTFYRTKFGYDKGSLPKTEEISDKILTLPISLNFKNEDQDYIINTIEEFFNLG